MRNKNVAPSAAEAKLLKAFNGTSPAPVNGYYPTLALVGGAPAGAVVRKLFDSKDENVRAAAAVTCYRANFGVATIEALSKLAADPSAKVRREAIRALALYANWRYKPAQQTLIRLAADKTADPLDRLNAADAIGYAVRLQTRGVRQDPEMFQALVSLAQEREGPEPVRSTAAGILMPLYQPAGQGAQRRRSPEGGWEKWIEDITAEAKGARKAYDVCATRRAPEGTPEPVDLFCMGGPALDGGKPALAFQHTLAAAEAGYLPAQSAVAMLYANGKGVQQNYAEAGKWWVKAAEGGDLVAARHAWNLYRNGEGVDRNPTIANQLAPMIGEPIQQPRNRTRPPEPAATPGRP
jgi:hypothetical protein